MLEISTPGLTGHEIGNGGHSQWVPTGYRASPRRYQGTRFFGGRRDFRPEAGPGPSLRFSTRAPDEPPAPRWSRSPMSPEGCGGLHALPVIRLPERLPQLRETFLQPLDRLACLLQGLFERRPERQWKGGIVICGRALRRRASALERSWRSISPHTRAGTPQAQMAGTRSSSAQAMRRPLPSLASGFGWRAACAGPVRGAGRLPARRRAPARR